MLSKEINGQMIRYSADHKVAFIMDRHGKVSQPYKSCKLSTGFYKAKKAAENATIQKKAVAA